MPPDGTFGGLLRRNRAQTTDPQTNRPLSQEKLAELLDIGSPAVISYWEHNERQIRADDRRLLLRLIQVLAQCGGIHTVSEADALLTAGNYRGLNPAEIAQWLPGLPPGDASGQPDSIPLQSVKGLGWLALLFHMEWPKDESLLAKAVLYLLGRPAEHLTPEGVLRAMGILLLWLLTAVAWLTLLSWPYPDAAAALRACAFWGGVAVLTPLLLGLGMKTDRQAHLLEQTGAHREIIALRTLGALGGYQIGAALALVGALLLYYLALWPLARWVVVGLAGLPLLLAYAAGRRTPDNYFRAFNGLRLDEKDAVVALAFLLLGPGLAAFFYFFRDWLLQPVVGVVLLTVSAGLTAALELASRRAGHAVVQPGVFALLLGIPLGLGLLVQPGAEPLFGMGLIALAATCATARGLAQISMGKLLGVVALLALAAALASFNRWLGCAGLVIAGAVAWWRFREVLLPFKKVGLVCLTLAGSAALLRWTTLPPWPVRAGFAAIALALLIWQIRRRST